MLFLTRCKYVFLSVNCLKNVAPFFTEEGATTCAEISDFE